MIGDEWVIASVSGQLFGRDHRSGIGVRLTTLAQLSRRRRDGTLTTRMHGSSPSRPARLRRSARTLGCPNGFRMLLAIRRSCDLVAKRGCVGFVGLSANRCGTTQQNRYDRDPCGAHEGRQSRLEIHHIAFLQDKPTRYPNRDDPTRVFTAIGDIGIVVRKPSRFNKIGETFWTGETAKLQ